MSMEQLTFIVVCLSFVKILYLNFTINQYFVLKDPHYLLNSYLPL